MQVIGARSALDYVKPYAALGEQILRSGEDHGWFHFFYRGGERLHTEFVAARDRADKFALSQQLAELAIRIGADGVLQVAEVWIGRLPEEGQALIPPALQPDRTEALQIYAEISSGETRGLIIPFSRSAFGGVQIGETIEESHPSNFLLPLRAAWRAGRRGAPEAGS